MSLYITYGIFTLKYFWLGIGWISLLLGVIGAFLPLLPTVPFLLLTAFCFSKGSETLHHWILSHPQFGPSIKQWQNEGAITPKAKFLSIGFMLCSVALSIALAVPLIGLVSQTFILICVATFILTRPNPRRQKSLNQND